MVAHLPEASNNPESADGCIASSAQAIFPSATHIIAYVEQSDGCSSLQCLDARTGNLVWSRERPGHEVRMAKFDLRSSTSAVMALSFSDPFAATTLHALSTVLVLFFWSTGGPGSSSSLVHSTHSFMPGTVPHNTRLQYLELPVRVYSFLSFDGLWGSIRKLDFNNGIDATQIRPSTTLELPGNAMVGKSHCEHIMTVLESPLRADTYELIFEVMDFDGPAVAETPFRRPFTRLLSLFRSNAP
ncbi:hypothetical protein B0H14DRAFT_2628967 [Mycena olivaceomarginata]|nr:hypothetical protein B0H14DRAFT_2628967 [Mycena olivaceomarginata]